MTELEEKKKLLFDQLMNQLVVQDWVNSEIQLSERYEQMGKIYRGKLKNKIPKDRVSKEYQKDERL